MPDLELERLGMPGRRHRRGRPRAAGRPGRRRRRMVDPVRLCRHALASEADRRFEEGCRPARARLPFRPKNCSIAADGRDRPKPDVVRDRPAQHPAGDPPGDAAGRGRACGAARRTCALVDGNRGTGPRHARRAPVVRRRQPMPFDCRGLHRREGNARPHHVATSPPSIRAMAGNATPATARSRASRGARTPSASTPHHRRSFAPMRYILASTFINSQNSTVASSLTDGNI